MHRCSVLREEILRISPRLGSRCAIITSLIIVYTLIDVSCFGVQQRQLRVGVSSNDSPLLVAESVDDDDDITASVTKMYFRQNSYLISLTIDR